jgi:signal peptidase I
VAAAHAARKAVLGVLAAAVVSVGLWLVLQMFVVQVFTVTAASMQPTLMPGDRVVVLRPTLDREIQPGDIVVADVRGTFVAGRPTTGPRAGTVLSPAPPDAYVVKRAVAGPGDRVTCCDDDGRVLVNGQPLDEPYVPDAVAPSRQPFDILVPAGRWWLMGDNRAVSDDSRSHLGSPGGGTVSRQALVGRVARAVGRGDG